MSKEREIRGEFYEFGKGKLAGKEGNLTYVGTLPFKPDEELIIMRMSDLETMLTHENGLLISTRQPMDDSLITGKNSFPDKVVQGNEISFYLDRHVYTYLPKNEVWIRYETVSRALEEESPFEDVGPCENED